MANGSFFGDIKSKFGKISSRNEESYEEDYDDYEEDYDDYDDGYEDSYDPYMDRNPVTTRGRGDAGLPRLVSIDDARASAPGFSTGRDYSSRRGSSGSRISSYGRTMVDSSLPSSMTAEGTAAAAASANRRAEGLDSLFGGSGSSSVSSSRSSSGIIRNSMQLSMPGTRQLQVIKPTKYDDAEAVTNVLKNNDVAIISFGSTDRDLMKRILDFSFGAASALDASVECIANGVFAICRSVGIDESERADLKSMGII